MKDINDFLLTGKTTVGQARKWMAEKDANAKANLIELIHHRFYSRYVKHVLTIESGFLQMAISCLTIETLESFVQGKENTKEKGVGLQMFKDFFARESMLFPGFSDISTDFYSSIRCGILHQAETTNAWRILRKDAILDKPNKSINASKFAKSLEKALTNYIDSLKSSDFDSELWVNAILKIEDICKNCKAS